MLEANCFRPSLFCSPGVFSCKAKLAQAQPKFKEIPPDPDFRVWNQIKTPKPEHVSRKNAIEDMLRGTAPYEEEQFKTFFNRAVFPQFTLQENIYYVKTVNKLKNTVCELPNMRREFRQEFMGREHSNRAGARSA